jgi:hypothetical protein
MANVNGIGGAGANNCKVLWTLDFDDAADTVTINAVHTHFDGSPAPDPQQAEITVQLNSSVDITVNLLTGTLSIGGNFSQASPGPMLNAGPKTRTGVRLKVSANRAAAIAFSTQYLAPA